MPPPKGTFQESVHVRDLRFPVTLYIDVRERTDGSWAWDLFDWDGHAEDYAGAGRNSWSARMGQPHLNATRDRALASARAFIANYPAAVERHRPFVHHPILVPREA